jgi:hypothetical protein
MVAWPSPGDAVGAAGASGALAMIPNAMPRGALKAGVEVTTTGFRGHSPNGLVMANVVMDVPPA